METDERNSKYNLNLPVTPTVSLVGKDGNAMVLMGICIREYKKALREKGYETTYINELANNLLNKFTRAESYDDLLSMIVVNFEVE